ncbi:MAG TPA: carboxypeptidase-like regulatory domain-containing protein [Chryseosolibacter sp.]|nr:carboxypeptidase-like regulatory domain-containing protein [Chryseosolibacter sp.]
MKKIWFLLIVTFSALSFSNIAERTISGVVTSADDGMPIPGVQVNVKSTTGGVTTDIHGKYQIKIQDDKAILVFSMPGFISEEIVAGSQAVINVQLKLETSPSRDIIIRGYATQKQKAVTGAATVAEPEMLSQGVFSLSENTEEYAGIAENIFAIR